MGRAKQDHFREVVDLQRFNYYVSWELGSKKQRNIHICGREVMDLEVVNVYIAV